MVKLNDTTVNATLFPNGESCIDIKKESVLVGTDEINTIKLNFESDMDLMVLRFLKDFVDEYSYGASSMLIMPYVPYCRMDRKEENRLFTLKSVTQMINSMNFTKVVIMEPHSDVTPALLDRVEVVNTSSDLALIAMRDALGLVGSIWLTDKNSMREMFELAIAEGIYLVYPDAGAVKRYSKQIKYPNILSCSKKREFNTGRITEITINETDIDDCKTAIIVDDLCSRGGTFHLIGKMMKAELGTKKVILAVTHCENTVLDGELCPYHLQYKDVFHVESVDMIITTNSIFTKSHPKINVIDVK